jgi:cadmium resistance protein CadD (predicted permease)
MKNQEPTPSSAPLEEIILIIMVILSLVGVAITDFSPQDTFMYWMVMIFVFGILAMIAGWSTAKRHHDTETEACRVKEFFKLQSLHWLGSLVTVICLFSFVEAGHMSQEATGLMVLLILALSTYLDGIRIGWRFCLTGMYLATAAVAANFVENFMPWLFVLAMLIIGVTVYLEKSKSAQA